MKKVSIIFTNFYQKMASRLWNQKTASFLTGDSGKGQNGLHLFTRYYFKKGLFADEFYKMFQEDVNMITN